jgi:hypothetical protein
MDTRLGEQQLRQHQREDLTQTGRAGVTRHVSSLAIAAATEYGGTIDEKDTVR